MENEIEFSNQGIFSIFDYHFGDKQLLLRHYEGVLNISEICIDIIFIGVAYMQLPINICNIHIIKGDQEDWKYIAGRLPVNVLSDIIGDQLVIYNIISNNRKYYVIARDIRISKADSIPIFQEKINILNIFNHNLLIRKLKFSHEGTFIMMAYAPSHSKILLRHSYIYMNHPVNLDILFDGVRYFEIPTLFKGIILLNGDEYDVNYIIHNYNNENDRDFIGNPLEVYKIVSEGKKYYIVATCLFIETNFVDQFNIE